ncbi:MAG: Maf family protein [Anaerolineae bacterium]
MLTLETLLASASPRRRALLRLLNIPYAVCSTDIDETPLPSETAPEMVTRLSRRKAETARGDNRDALIIACDTTVELDGQIYGKPTDPDDARRILRTLRGRAHSVYGGVTVAFPPSMGQEFETFVVRTRVWMRNYTEAEIEAYVSSGDPMDKAAAYAVQHPLFRPVERMDGCFANVMGLSLCRLHSTLAPHVSMPQPDIECYLHLEENCTVARLVAAGAVAGA